MTGLTRDQAREQIARAIYTDERKSAGDAVVDRMWNRAVKSDALTRRIYDQRADAALSVLWPEVERIRRGAATLGATLDRTLLDIVNATDSQDLINEDGDGDWALVHERLAAMGAMVRRSEGLEAEVERLTAELAHAHAVIARHVEPRREGEP